MLITYWAMGSVFCVDGVRARVYRSRQRAGKRPRRSRPSAARELADELAGGQGTIEQVALQVVAAARGEEVALGLGLDALGDHLQAEAVAEGDDGGGDLAVGAVLADVPHEAAVDLQQVDIELAQVGERRVARAEVVDRQRH